MGNSFRKPDTAYRDAEYRTVLNCWKTRGIHHEICPSAPVCKLWEQVFSVTEEMTASVPSYNDQFLWHRFSFGILPHARGNEALRKFDETAKSALVLFHHEQEDAIFLTGCELLRASDIVNLRESAPFAKTDIYLMPAENPTWTFVITHEPGLGPYFCRISP